MLAKYYNFWLIRYSKYDYIEEKDGKIFAYEFKWNAKRKANISKTFIQAYKPEMDIINRENFEKFVLVL